MFCYEAVCAYLNMFNTYSNVNWDFSQKNAIKITRGNNKNCFRKLKVTKAYNFDLFFSPYVYKWEEMGLLKKKEMKYTSWVVLVLRVTENDS